MHAVGRVSQEVLSSTVPRAIGTRFKAAHMLPAEGASSSTGRSERGGGTPSSGVGRRPQLPHNPKDKCPYPPRDVVR